MWFRKILGAWEDLIEWKDRGAMRGLKTSFQALNPLMGLRKHCHVNSRQRKRGYKTRATNKLSNRYYDIGQKADSLSKAMILITSQ